MDTNPIGGNDQPQPQQPNNQPLEQPSPVEPVPESGAVNQAPVPLQPFVSTVPSFTETTGPGLAPTSTPIVSPATATPVQQKSANTPGVVVLQWLVYAFWGWTAVSLISLAASVFARFIADAEVGDFSLYALSSALVLLPISTLCDVFYAKKEPPHKHGAAVAVMLIHAVIFALLGVGSLISLVFAVISIVTANGESSGQVVWALTSVFAAVVYAVLFARTALVGKFSLIKKLTPIIMSSIVIVFSVAAIVGPVMGQVRTRNDRLIESNIGNVSRAVDNYIQENNKLPASLDDINLEGDASVVVTKGLVTYEPSTATNGTLDYFSGTRASSSTTTKYTFTLCATYTDKKKNPYSSSRYDQDQNATSLYVYGHDAGKVCYDLTSTVYQYN